MSNQPKASTGAGEQLKLPIDVIPGTDPPRFSWTHVVDTFSSREVIPMDALVPATLETPLLDLIDLAKELHKECVQLRRVVANQADRLMAERGESQETPKPVPSKPPPESVPKRR